MDQVKIEKIIKDLQQSYNNISEDFARTRQRSWPVVDALANEYLTSGQVVLDAGCGNGRLLSTLADLDIPLHYYGLDNSHQLLAAANARFGTQYKKVKITWQEGSLTKLPFVGDNFDFIFAIASFHHIPAAELRSQVAQEFYRVLKTQGHLLLTNWSLFTWPAFQKYKLWPQLFNFVRGYDWGDFFIPWKNVVGQVEVWRYYHSFSQPELERLLVKNGLVVLKNKAGWLSDRPASVAKSLITLAKKVDELA